MRKYDEAGTHPDYDTGQLQPFPDAGHTTWQLHGGRLQGAREFREGGREIKRLSSAYETESSASVETQAAWDWGLQRN